MAGPAASTCLLPKQLVIKNRLGGLLSISNNRKLITKYVSGVLPQHKNLDFNVGSLVSQKREQKC